MAYETLRYQVKEAIATITLDPDAYNAIDLTLTRELLNAAPHAVARALARATAPSHAALGLGWRACVSRSTATRPNFGR